jgi:ribonuclease J
LKKINAQLTVYDGAGCIGGNKLYLNSGNTGLLLDFGMNFSSVGMFYEEFLKPRVSAKGLNDLIKMGLTPDLTGVYRKDALLEETTGPELNVDAVFLSHAHADHVSYLGLLDVDIPIYCSPVTAAMIKATQDSTNPAIDGETVIFSPRVLNPKTDEPILKKENSYGYFWRRYLNAYAEPTPDAFQDYWTANLVSEANTQKKCYDCLPVSFGVGAGAVGSVKYEAIPVDHSVYGAAAFVFTLEDGKTVCYTGDFRLHGLRGETSLRFKERLRQIRPDYLIVEGTNVGGHKGNDLAEAQRASEEDVYVNCLATVRAEAGELVVADFGPRNIERLLTFLKIAEETDRKLVVTTKDLLFLQAMGTADDIINAAAHNPNLVVYLPPKVALKPWELYGMERCGCRSVDAAGIDRNPGDYIISFSYFDFNNLVDIDPGSGAYIYSTCEAFNEEMQIDARRLMNWLRRFHLRPYGIAETVNKATGETDISFMKGYHASGHISTRELTDFIDYVQPGCVIPIHTEHPELFDEMLAGRHRIVIPEPGQTIAL